MQVSWIDKDRLQELVARLEAPSTAAAVEDPHSLESLEIATLPEFGGFFAEDDEEPSATPDLPEPPDESMLPSPPAPTPLPAQALKEEIDSPIDETQPIEQEDVSLPLERIRERLRAIRHRAVEAGLLNRQEPPTASEAPPPSVPAHDSSPESEPNSRDRIARWAESVVAALPAGNTLILLDDHGGVLWANESKPGLILSTLMAIRAGRHASIGELAEEPIVSHHSLPPNHVLSISTLSCRSGSVQVAIKGEAPIEPEVVEPWRTEVGTWQVSLDD